MLKVYRKKDKIELIMLSCYNPTVLLEIHHILIKLLINFLKRTMSLYFSKKTRLPTMVLFVLNKNKLGQFLNFKNKNVFNLERQEFPKLFRPNGAIYISKRKVLKLVI